MTPKERAEEIVNSYRIILMNENTECGNEILCTSIAKKCALLAVEEMISQMLSLMIVFNEDRSEFESIEFDYLTTVKQEIEKL
jgi:hypothetical protein